MTWPFGDVPDFKSLRGVTGGVLEMSSAVGLLRHSLRAIDIVGPDLHRACGALDEITVLGVEFKEQPGCGIPSLALVVGGK